MPSTPPPTGWNTWDVRFHTGWLHLPSGLRARLALRSASGELFDGFTWRHGFGRLGHHTVDGSYAALRAEAFDSTVDFEAAGGERLGLRARVEGGAGVTVLVDRKPGYGEGAPVFTGGGEAWTVEAGGRTWALSAAGASESTVDGDVLRLDFGAEALVGLSAEPSTGAEISARVDAARESADAARPRSGGWLGDAADAMTRALTWNTIHAPDTGKVLTPTSRDFVSRERDGFYGSWALHTWDTFFTGLVASWLDPAYGAGVFAQIADHVCDGGMLPNRVSDDGGTTRDRSQPPVGAYTVLKAHLGGGLSEETRDRTALERMYPVLRDWHAWWTTARVGPHGLLTWGSDPVPGDPDSATVDRARRESGLDDSPMYDHATLDPATHTMDLADVGLNALHIADARALAEIAAILGHHDEAETLTKAAATATTALDALLWDAEHAQYRNRLADGRFSPHLSPTMLYPLLAGAPDAETAAALAEDLLAPDRLGGDPPLPSTSRDDPGFSARYWRGRVWAPMVFLAVEGLRRYDLTAHSRSIVDSLLALFLREWAEHGHVRENYPVVPGEDVRPLAARSDGLMGWGGLLGYLAVQELADPREDGWRFAHPGRPASVTATGLAEGPVTVEAQEPALRVRLGDRVLLEIPADAIVTGYTRERGEVRGVLTGSGGTALVAVPDAAGHDDVELRIGGARTRVRPDARGLVAVTVAGTGPVEFGVSAPERGEK
ncbi:trehalase family glycosidase [Phytomonospora sp. NPDC050363]|uniref:MGH1-like glycoside hydrolase domain-containing protein n=1 Tax=Phytomonospora sp. NPDC050363 TaxID=3155642 RepID=UPI0033D67797